MSPSHYLGFGPVIYEIERRRGYGKKGGEKKA
jgi:hypothetical protein